MIDLDDYTCLNVCVEIAGVPQRFHSHFAPNGFGGIITDNVWNTSVDFQEVPGIVDTSSYSWRIDVRECRASYQNFWIDIATDGVDALPGDPIEYLDRLVADDGGWTANLIQGVDYSDPTILVDAEAPATWTYPKILDLDGEAVEATGFLGTGVLGDEWRFTVNRGVAMTERRPHRLSPLLAPPRIAEYVTSWEGRIVRILVAPLNERGKAFDDFRELMVGVMARAPHNSGTSIRLEVAPLSTLTDVEISGDEAEEVGLFNGAHGFTPISPNGIDILIQSIDPGPAFYLFKHRFNPDSIPGSVMAQWPAAIAEANASFAAETAAGAPFIVRIVSDGDGYRLSVTTDAAIDEYKVWAWSSLDLVSHVWDEEPVSLVDGTGPLQDHLRLTHGLDLGVHGLPITWRAGPQILDRRSVAGQPVTAAENEWVWSREVDTGGAAAGHESSWVVRGAPTGFYEVGEEWIMVEPASDGGPPVTVPITRPASVQITYHDRAANESREITVRVEDCYLTPTDVGDSYTLALHPLDIGQVPAFGNWPGSPQVRLKQSTAFEGIPPGQLILELLESGTGMLVNGMFDVHPVGAGIPSHLIDEPSILGIPAPDGADERTVEITGAKKISDLIQQALVVSRHVLVMKTGDDGLSRLTAVSIGPAAASESVGELTEGDFTIDAPGSNDVWADTVNMVTFKVPLEGGDEREVRVPSPGGIARRSGDVQSIEIDLTNTRPVPAHDGLGDIEERVTSIAGLIFTDLADPRMRWDGEVPVRKLLFAAPGSVMKFTHSRLRGTKRTSTSGRYGVESQPARLLAADIPIMSGEAARLSAAHHGFRFAGWNAALRVNGIVDPMTVKVDLDTYSADDLAGFVVGDKARIEPAGNQDAAVTANIVAIDTVTGEVEFDVAHALTAPHYGYVVPEAFTSGSLHQRELAYYSDTSGQITPTEEGIKLG